MTIPLASTAPTVDPPVMLTLVRWAPRMTAITPSVTLVKADIIPGLIDPAYDNDIPLSTDLLPTSAIASDKIPWQAEPGQIPRPTPPSTRILTRPRASQRSRDD